MKNKRDIIIVTVCLLTAIACIVLVFAGNGPATGRITTETYIGVMAAMIGICAAMIVGFQIAHFIELRDLKNQIDELRETQKEIDGMSAELKDKLSFVRVSVSNAFRVLYRKFGNDPLAPVYCVISIIICDTTNIKLASKTLFANYKKLHGMLTHPHCDIKLLKYYLQALKEMDFPKELDNHSEICKLHYEVISILEEGK